MKIGRNDPCYCNSGKKYKKCHLNKPQYIMTSEFYADRIKKNIAVKYGVMFKLNNNLRTIVDEMINVKYPKASLKSIFSAYALAKAYKTHSAIITLCRDGYGEDAAILSRSMFDLLLNMLYILKDDTDYRINRYLDYDWILRYKVYQYARTKETMVKMMDERERKQGASGDTRKTIEKTAEQIQERYKYHNRGWSDKSIRDMAEEVERLDVYNTVYKLHSQITHNATRSMNDYIKAGEKGFIVEIGSTENWVMESLVTAFDFLCSIAGEYDRLNRLGFEKKLNELTESWVNAVDKI